MRYANPPGLAAFYAKNVGYDLLGAQGVRDSVANDLAAMGSIAKAQSTGLEVAGKDEAADELRKAGAYAAAQQRGASTFGAITGAVGTLGSAGIQKFGGGFGNELNSGITGVVGGDGGAAAGLTMPGSQGYDFFKGGRSIFG
jgi:hypothetical protein